MSANNAPPCHNKPGWLGGGRYDSFLDLWLSMLINCCCSDLDEDQKGDVALQTTAAATTAEPDPAAAAPSTEPESVTVAIPTVAAPKETSEPTQGSERTKKEIKAQNKAAKREEKEAAKAAKKLNKATKGGAVPPLSA